MKYLRWLLLPFSMIYGLVVILRNFCYDAGLFTTVNFKKPVISVGNLDVGGAGKSPMTEYLIRLLKKDHHIATLSRGYGRNTKGYILAATDTSATTLGDEPAQFKHKFPDITVAVCEDRVRGLKNLMPDHDLVLLDDAYQHRAVTPGLSILLFDYSRLNTPHLLLPAGNLREPFSGRWRAQVLVVTKCPWTLTIDAKEAAAQLLAPLPYQSLFFASIAYQPMLSLTSSDNMVIDAETTVFLLTAIANSVPLLQYLSGLTRQIIHHKYPDHHQFTRKNITKLAAEFSRAGSQKKLIVTTEKDAQRLEISWFKRLTPEGFDLPVFVLPVKVEFLDDGGGQFDQLVTNYVRERTAYSGLH